MGNFKNNFSELLLLANENIKIKDKESDFEFEIIPMKLKDILFDDNLGTFLSTIDKEVEELSKMIPQAEIKSHFGFIRTVCILGKRKEEIKDFANSLEKGLKKIIPDISFSGQIFYIQERVLNNEIFEEILETIYKIMEKEKILIKEKDDEFTKREKMIKLRAQRLRKNGKKEKEKEEGSGLKNVIASIIYEFPQYKVEDIFNLNIYTFNYLTKYIGKIANYEVSKIAAGNGLTKKHKYFIEK